MNGSTFGFAGGLEVIDLGISTSTITDPDLVARIIANPQNFVLTKYATNFGEHFYFEHYYPYTTFGPEYSYRAPVQEWNSAPGTTPHLEFKYINLYLKVDSGTQEQYFDVTTNN